MRNKSFIRFAALIAFVWLSSSAFPARAQQFGPWSTPVNLNNIVLTDGTVCPAVVNSTSPDVNDTHPAISKDGLSLYFASTRPGPDVNGQVGLGDYDLWVTHRDSPDACWGPPVNLGAVVNSPVQDFAPNLTTDGHWLYFHSTRHTWLTADGLVVPSCGPGANLYVSHRDDTSNDLGWETQLTWVAQSTRPALTWQALPTSRTMQPVPSSSISRPRPSVRAMSFSESTSVPAPQTSPPVIRRTPGGREYPSEHPPSLCPSTDLTLCLAIRELPSGGVTAWR